MIKKFQNSLKENIENPFLTSKSQVELSSLSLLNFLLILNQAPTKFWEQKMNLSVRLTISYLNLVQKMNFLHMK